MTLTRYSQTILDTISSSGICSEEQLAEVDAVLRGLSGQCAVDAPQIWRHISSKILLPSHDFAVHLRLAAVVYDGWPTATLGRPPLWFPDPTEATRTNIGRFLQSIQDAAWWRAACMREGDDGSGGGGGRNSNCCPPGVSAGAGEDGGAVAQLPSGLAQLLREWRVLQRASWSDPETFWRVVLRDVLGLHFAVAPYRMLQRHPTDPDQCRWLPGARLNIAACALASPRAPQGSPALLWAPDGAPTAVRSLSRSELRSRVRLLAACIRRRFKPGDLLALYMPMTPDAVCLYLATVLAGCVVVSVADSFSAAELRTRLDIAGAVGVFTQDVVRRGGKALPLYDKVVQSGTAATAVVLPASGDAAISPPGPNLRPGDLPWRDFLTLAGPEEAAALQHHVADAYDITNVLFSSGTTGEPKAIPWTHVTPLRCAVDGWAQLDVRPGSVVAWPTSLGWMMGPWLLYAALLNGATVALYGGAPLGRDFLQFVRAARVDVLGLVPSIVRSWRHGGAVDGPGAGAGAGEAFAPDLSCVRVFGSTGEASSAEDYTWLMSRGRGYRPVIEYCGGTEIGGGYVSGTLLHPCAPSTFSTPTLGTRMVLLSQAAAEGEGPGGAAVVWDGGPRSGAVGSVAGEVALAMPMMGVSQCLLNRDHFKVYYDGMPLYGNTGMPLRRHGDEVAALPALGPGPSPWAFCALGRCDDTMNLGGIKVSSVELERAVVEGVEGVAEAAAVGVAPPQGGPEELHLFLVLTAAGGAGAGAGASMAAFPQQPQQLAALHRHCQEAVRLKLNPLFKVTRVAVVPSLPRNASNKVMRRVLRDALPGRSRL